jgi:histidinol-phosphate aminotransferase
MRDPIGPDRTDALTHRGLTRRDLARFAALFAAGAALPALPFTNEAALAQGPSMLLNLPPDAVRINANENPMGPCPEAAEAASKFVARGGRYGYEEMFKLLEAMAAVEGLPKDHVMPFAGSSDPLNRSVLAFTAPDRSFVIGDPGYEAGEKVAQFLGAKVVRVPLRKDYAHDVHAMAKADSAAGLIYVCNPNNPTGSVTRKADIEYLVANKPQGAVVLLDEAYIHLSETAEPGTAMVAAGKDVIILRSFSKIYGLAGLRAGAALARPDLLAKLRGLGMGAVPTIGMVAATVSLKVKGLVESRRKIIADIRQETAGWLESKGYTVIPSEANMLMFDTRRPSKQVFDALLKEKVAIGRPWPSVPTHVRISIGTAEEMAKFRTAFERVMGA